MRAATKAQLAKVAPTWILVAALTGCLMPPASVVQSAQASSAPADKPAEKNYGDVPAPAKPTGILISDGTTTTVMNLHPGGGWFTFHDPTTGTMTPPSAGD